jgi:hypothetical protein
LSFPTKNWPTGVKNGARLAIRAILRSDGRPFDEITSKIAATLGFLANLLPILPAKISR